MGRRGDLVLALAVTLGGGCNFAWPAPFETDRGVYSEFLAFAEVEQQLPTLAAHTTELYLAIRPSDVGTGALESVLLGARRNGVPVRAWLLLDDADGYWPGEHNLAAFDDHVRTFWDWSESLKLEVEWILVDMEPSLEVSNMLAGALESGDLASAVPVLLANRDRAKFDASREAWIDAVDDWHDQGIRVAVVGLPYLLDDFGDDDPDIQDMFDSPLDGPDWDEVGFLVYQNLYGTADARLGAPLVFDYARTARDRYGDRAAIALGTVGDIGKNTSSIGYSERAALEADLDAARGADIAKLHVFGLDGMQQRGGTDEWIADLAIEGSTPTVTDAVVQARAMVSTLDGN
jgi:hypothetical protein